MGRIPKRAHRDTDSLKRLATELDKGGQSRRGILEHLNDLDLIGESPVSYRLLGKWLNDVPPVEKAELIAATFSDVMAIRQRAFHATAMCEMNRYAYITERAYWMGLYISALHILLRQALALEAAAELPPQFIMPQLEQFYKDIRTFRQQTPLLAEEEESVEELRASMRAFEKKFAKNLKLPKETL